MNGDAECPVSVGGLADTYTLIMLMEVDLCFMPPMLDVEYALGASDKVRATEHGSETERTFRDSAMSDGAAIVERWVAETCRCSDLVGGMERFTHRSRGRLWRH